MVCIDLWLWQKHYNSHLLENGYRVSVEHRDMMKNNVEEDYNPHEIKTLGN